MINYIRCNKNTGEITTNNIKNDIFGEYIIETIPKDIVDDAVNFIKNNLSISNTLIFSGEDKLKYLIKSRIDKCKNSLFNIKDFLIFDFIHLYEIACGNFIEQLLREIINRRQNYIDIHKNNNITYYYRNKINKLTGDIISLDKCNKQILFIECKSSDQLDVAKRIGEIEKYEQKIDAIQKEYPEYDIQMWYYYDSQIRPKQKQILHKSQYFIHYIFNDEISQVLTKEEYIWFKVAKDYINSYEPLKRLSEIIDDVLKNKNHIEIKLSPFDKNEKYQYKLW